VVVLEKIFVLVILVILLVILVPTVLVEEADQTILILAN
jgi:hypothetical protein